MWNRFRFYQVVLVLFFGGHFEAPRGEQMRMKTQISRPNWKPKPTKAFEALFIFNMFTTVSGGIRELSSYPQNWQVKLLFQSTSVTMSV